MGASTHRLMISFMGLFLLLQAWTAYWTVWRGPELAAHSRNSRPALVEGRAARGSILDRTGRPLVISEWQRSSYKRRFVGPLSAVQTIGYMHSRYGKTGLERTFDLQLRGKPGIQEGGLTQRLTGIKGDDVITTLDLDVQAAAEKALAGRKGAVVALEANSGAILAAASVPFFDPADMTEELFAPGGSGALFNRALQGRYAPGSSWKPLVLAAALESRAVTPDLVFEDTGSIIVDGHEIHNYEGEMLGTITLEEALIYSSNVAFVQIGIKTSGEAVIGLAQRMGLLTAPELNTPAAASHLPALKDFNLETVRAQVGFGQGEVWVTPLHMAVVAAVIGNGGYAVQPYLVSQMGDQLLTPKIEPKRIMPSWVAEYVGRAMTAVVTQGTGRRAALPDIAVAGKTGTAQNPAGGPHAWFIAFAPAQKARVAVAVVLENAGGTGGALAAPVAAEVIAAALRSDKMAVQK